MPYPLATPQYIIYVVKENAIKIRKAHWPCVALEVGWIIGFEPTTSRATTWHSNQLSYIHQIIMQISNLHSGALEGTRTPDPLLRRQLLYPPELQAHIKFFAEKLHGWDDWI